MIRDLLAPANLPCALIITLLLATSANADDATGFVEPAISAYREAMESTQRDERLERFRRAERLFAAAIEQSGGSGELYANLGNASLQAERLGPAVLAYRRALLIDPSLERARQNLLHARGLLPDWVPSPPEAGLLDSFFGWHNQVSRSDKLDLAALAFAVAILSLAASLAFGFVSARYITGLASAVWFALLASIALDPSRAAGNEAVVVARDVLARAADSVNAPSRFGEPLPSGTELRVLDDRGGWLQIELHNGRNAWVVSSAVERIAASDAVASSQNSHSTPE
jgi:tetratricopeptide (TPR) repeat protein